MDVRPVGPASARLAFDLMRENVRQKLRDLNRAFYDEFAISFAETRRAPQPGFYQLADHLPQPCPRLLDVGCGEGRLGRFLLSRGAVETYHGVDASPALLEIARQETGGKCWLGDLAQPGALDMLGAYDCITCLAVLQHIPGRKQRIRLLTEMATHLASTGRLILSTWQFLTSERQRRKIVGWSEVGLSSDEVEENDYLLTWRKDGLGFRYVCYIDEEEVADLASVAGLSLQAIFRADGREGDLNLYVVLSHARQTEEGGG